MTSRLRIELMPEKYDEARKLLDTALRSVRTVLQSFRWREQVPGVVTTVIDTAAFPVSVAVPGVSSVPMAVVLLRAVEQRSADGIAISGGVVTWEWRGGALLIHDIDSLAVTTRYNATIAVME